ncbi:MAG: ATP phosphoribosyltransferase regulatory subunit [Ruminiclostridium sp.]|nr:ATP phosphoribosyltransferase regulatory subunit [Ruminiclostridium sp.]
MSKWKIHTPEGVQDILFDECALKRNIEDKLRGLYRSYGYFEVETPTIEFYDVFSSGTGLIPQETMFKFFDQQGRILVLRPDITVPVARISATKYREMPYPMRFSYIGNVFRYNDYGGGKQSEFTQAGVEVLGAGTSEADAEVIAIAINALKAAGLDNFKLDIGQVEFFNGLMDETKLSDEETDLLKVMIDRKDYVGVEELLGKCEMGADLKKLIIDLPALFGSADVIDRVEALALNKRSLDALENIRQVLNILDDYGLSKYVSVDLGMLKGLNYDTGIIFRGFTYGIGFPILTGGRYDRLVEEFGRQCPATGFSLGVSMIMTALQRQKADIAKPCIDSIVCYSQKGRKTALNLCGELRRQGLIIELDLSTGGVDAVKKYAAGKNIGGVINVSDEETIEIHDIATGAVNKTGISELVKGCRI